MKETKHTKKRVTETSSDATTSAADLETKHYMYVLECSDGTLYTGYIIDVEARVATHNAGKGAKYTAARRPVKLLASATFDTKHDAMSAEYHFKQLSRTQKDQLIAAIEAACPFEVVLEEFFSSTKKSECENNAGTKKRTREDDACA